MRVTELVDGLALCDGVEVMTDLVGRWRRRRAARPRRGRAGAPVRYVDEFRDAGLGRVLAGEIVATVEPGGTTR